MISLRQAKFDDHWRTAFKRQYPLVLKSMRFQEGKVFDGAKLVLRPGVNAIVGKNGVGKSNFVRALYNSLMGESSNRERFSRLLDESTVQLDMVLAGTEYSVNLAPLKKNEVDHDILCLLYDPCTLIPEIQALFSKQDNLEELLEGFSPVRLSGEELRLANFIANTSYSSVEIVNIEDEYTSFPILPFFIVCRDGVRYDSRDMGLGELSLLYYFWIIGYVSDSGRNCLLIIEEPESFLPPLIQNRLCDVLAMVLAVKGIACLISTHSEHVLRKIPRDHIHVMSRVMGKVHFFNAASHFEQMSVLGLTAPKKAMIFYEDKAAFLFFCALLKFSSLYVKDSFYYHCSGSEGDVLTDLKRFPSGLSGFSFVAMFDGDSRVNMSDKLVGFNNYIFLPSKLSPEEALIAYIEDLGVEALAGHLGKSVEDINVAIDVAAGLDHHDYFMDISRTLKLSYDDLFARICDLWISDPDNKNSVESFVSQLEHLVSKH